MTEQALAGTAGEGTFVYSLEDAQELEEILGKRYTAVVGNPPYITVKDPTLNKLYRELWPACAGKYAPSVPFVQRFFDLAVPGGFVGQITANSFMKRGFGRKLIEQYLPTQDCKRSGLSCGRGWRVGAGGRGLIVFECPGVGAGAGGWVARGSARAGRRASGGERGVGGAGR